MVQKKFYEIFEPLINLSIIEICKKMEKKFENEINKISLTVSGLQGDCSARDIVITQLRTENTALKSQLSDIVSKRNEMEQYSRMDNLVINGLKTSAADVAGADVVANSSTSLQKQFIDFCNNDLHITVMPEDISTVHKLPANRNGNSSDNSSNGNSNVIFRFTKRSVRDNVFFAKKALCDYNINNTDKIYVKEDLTAHTRKFFNAARYKLKN